MRYLLPHLAVLAGHVQSGVPVTGACSGSQFFPMVLTYRGEGRIDVALTYKTAEESATQCRQTSKATVRFELRR